MHMYTCTHAHAHACTYAHAHDHACTHAHAHLQPCCSVQCSCTSYSQILQCRTMAIPLDQQGLSGFAMPGPYGLQDYCHSLLPAKPSNDDIMQALQLFKFPQEAYPKPKKHLDVTWRVDTPKEDLRKLPYKYIDVLLRKQVFVSVPSPYMPSTDIFQPDPAFGKSYFSFFTSYEHEIGPVVKPMPPGTRDIGHRGYNHVSAELAWGEAKILAGMAGKEFVLQWSHNFKLEMVNSGHDINGLQLYPPVLKQFVWHCWPDIAMAATTTVDTNWDTSWELLDLQKVEHDVLHTMANVEAEAKPKLCHCCGFTKCVKELYYEHVELQRQQHAKQELDEWVLAARAPLCKRSRAEPKFTSRLGSNI